MKWTFKRYMLILSLVAFIGSSAGCGTVKGLGSDIKKAGKGIGKIIPGKGNSEEKKSE
jgi:predicted small secreted protein